MGVELNGAELGRLATSRSINKCILLKIKKAQPEIGMSIENSIDKA
jgi:hypothetical protein